MEIAVTGSGDDDELTTLVERVREGNAAAFDELARLVRDRIRRWARRVVGDDDEAEDVAQLVLVRVHDRIRDFEGRSRFGSWLYRITTNVALERRRSEVRRSALLTRLLSGPEYVTTEAVDADQVDAEGVRRALVAHFDALSPRQREVFELVDLRGLTAREAAKTLGIEPSTVRVLLLRARRSIRARMLGLSDTRREDPGQ